MQKMNPPKCDDLDYIHFLIAAQKVFTCTEAARCQPEGQHSPAHDAFTRLLRRQPLDTEALWQEAKPFVDPKRGLLVLDDTTLDKPYAQQMELVTYHWIGKHQRVVRGIALLTLLWTDGQAWRVGTPAGAAGGRADARIAHEAAAPARPQGCRAVRAREPD